MMIPSNLCYVPRSVEFESTTNDTPSFQTRINPDFKPDWCPCLLSI